MPVSIGEITVETAPQPQAQSGSGSGGGAGAGAAQGGADVKTEIENTLRKQELRARRLWTY
jgi:hypothetical protein